MFDRLKRKREITDLEKTEIVIEYLRDKLEVYAEYSDLHHEIEPVKLLEIILNYEERKHFFMTNRENYNYIQRSFDKETA